MVNGHTINKATKRRISTIIPVHIFGNAVNIEPLISICSNRNIKIVEDASESLGTYYTEGNLINRYTGTIGDIGCYSFNGNKIVTAGGGGMIVTDNREYADRARYLTTQAKDDQIRYIHNDIGYNYRLTNIQAALGVAQLEKLWEFINIKKSNYNYYKHEIDRVPGLHLAEVPSYSNNNHWMYPLQIDEIEYGLGREKLMNKFTENGIQSRPLWYLNHLQKPYENDQTYNITNSYEMLDKTLNIPCSVNLTRQEINQVLDSLKKWKI